MGIMLGRKFQTIKAGTNSPIGKSRPSSLLPVGELVVVKKGFKSLREILKDYQLPFKR